MLIWGASAVGLAVTAVGLLALGLLYPACDTHGERTSVSPDGRWLATLNVEGCPPAFIPGMNWHSMVTVLAASPVSASPVTVLDYDGDDISFEWPNRDTLNLKILDIVDIKKSERSVSGLSIQYSVDAGVLAKLRNEKSSVERSLSAPDDKSLSPRSRKFERQLDRQYALYLDKFAQRVQSYVMPSHASVLVPGSAGKAGSLPPNPAQGLP